ncbi:transient receptor potential cation channel subfamily M member-like 2 isoform X2 [Ptychodera flava]|uniref:transient receptor potential cation channel subfamily M member-like 2 isoform X2 n=1 Tax=Ptychodera flava TaxID=63121 RepID=UPI00396A67F0
MDKGAKGDAAGIPVVIIKGSGRAADIIAEAYLRSRNTEMSDDRIVADQEKNVRDLIAHVKNGRWRNTLMEECLNHLKQIIAPQNRRLITIFQKDDSNFVEIVNALWQESKNDILDTTEKLKLATVLNRYDTIEDFIKKEDRIQEPEVHQMDVEDPLHMFKKELKREKSEKWLDGIGSLLRKLTGDEYNALYKEFKGRPEEANVSDPNKHLFLWAVLLNRRKLAILFLKRLTTGSIGTALIASRILRELSVYAKRKNKLTLHSDVLQLSGEFKDVALGTLERLYEADSKNCELAVVRTLPAFGNTTCLSTAYSSNNRKFIGHDCCQSKLQSVWNGNLCISSRTQWIAFFVGIILPIFPVMMLLNDYPEESSGSGKIERFFISVRNYYTAPITKFVYNFVSYIVLLLLFAFFLLTDLRPYGEANSPGTIEWIVVVWVTTMVVEEVRQLIARAPKSMKYKAISWISDVWNMLDFAMYLLFAVSFLLHLILPPNVFVAARVMYCMTYIIFCLRPLQFGFVLKEVGPKTIMIFKMMKDLAYFLFILILFLVGFGVAVEAILYPNMDPHFNLIARALYKPFWYLYGELFLEEIEGRIDNVTCYEDPRFMNVCPQVGEYQWVVHGLTAIYLLISNILLINLLIAMFSFTFGKVQENAELIWKFHRYALIFEYVDRPTLAPPLIIIEHVFRLIKDLKMRLTEKCLKEEEEEEQQQQQQQQQQQYLNQLEKRHLNDYLIEKDQQQIKSTERRVKSIDERVDKAVLEVCEIKSSISKLRLELKDEIDIMKKDILYEISKIKTKE